jgi:cobaltochelatase CobS
MTAATKAGPTHIEVKRNDREIMVLIDEAKRGELVKACGRRLTNTGITNWLTFKNHELRSFLKGEADPKQGQAVQAAATVATAKANGDGGILDAIAAALDGKIKAGLDEGAVIKIVKAHTDGLHDGMQKTLVDELELIQAKMGDRVQKALDNMPPKEIIVTTPKGSTVKMGYQHKHFEQLLKLMSAGLNVWLAGPAGSGKTQAAENVAKALDKSFFPYSVGPQTSKTDLIGYMDAHGKYVRTIFREAYEHGGILLLDEIDSANPAVLTMINAALANGYCSFADQVVARHADFACIASGNTYGSGANRVYVGRSQIDGATIDRFFFMEWTYDTALEEFISKDSNWLKIVHAVRAAVEQHKLRHIVGTRAIMFGEAALASGLTQAEAVEGVIWKGLDETAKNKIKTTVKADHGITL